MAGTHISQVAMVVKDLDATMQLLNETLGWGPWNVYEHVPPKLHHQELRGKPADYSMLGAECEVQPGLVVGTQRVGEVVGRHRTRQVIDTATADAQNLRLLADRQIVFAVDHRLALSNPALLSAPSKKQSGAVRPLWG